METFSEYGKCVICGYHKSLNYSGCCKSCFYEDAQVDRIKVLEFLNLPKSFGSTDFTRKIQHGLANKTIQTKEEPIKLLFNWITKKYPSNIWELLTEKQQEYVALIIMSVMKHCNGKKPCERCLVILNKMDKYINQTIKLNHLKQIVPIFKNE